ncbi:hypothetical protein LTS10_009048 [Elasticomyces elasticus]|nr:hypothetical protein LTS10_009048 [Elasticomyces elasticus]
MADNGSSVPPTTNNPPQHHERAQSRCPLLQLPAELRVNIYEFAFAVNKGATVDLFAAEPLPRELLLTCHEIHNETVALYKQARRDYWSSTKFFAKDLLRAVALSKLPLLQQTTIVHITSLELSGVDEEFGSKFEVTYSEGLWQYAEYETPAGPDGGGFGGFELVDTTKYLVLPTKDKRTNIENALLKAGRLTRHINEYTAKPGLCAFVNITGVNEGDRLRVRAYAKTKALSLWELEGVIRYTLPHS